MLRQFTVLIRKDGDGYLAHCLETEIFAKGVTPEEAQENLRNTIVSYLKTIPQEKYPKEGVDLYFTRIEVTC